MIYVIIAVAWSIVYWLTGVVDGYILDYAKRTPIYEHFPNLPRTIAFWAGSETGIVIGQLVLIIGMIASIIYIFVNKAYRVPIKTAAALYALCPLLALWQNRTWWGVVYMLFLLLSVAIFVLAIVDLAHENKLADLTPEELEEYNSKRRKKS